MLYALIIIIICSVLYLIFKLKKTTSKKEKTSHKVNENEPRDFIANSDVWLKPPIELRILVDKNRDDAINFLKSKLSNGAIQVRKYATFALGQIGDEKISTIFEIWLKRESDQSVRCVMKACQTAIKLASAEKGFTEYQRRLIIDDLLKQSCDKF
jgi:HEAT repeat protein